MSRKPTGLGFFGKSVALKIQEDYLFFNKIKIYYLEFFPLENITD